MRSERVGDPDLRARSLAYWETKLDGAVGSGLGVSVGAELDDAKRIHRFSIPFALSEELDEFARNTRSTPFATLLAAYIICLHALTGGRDISVPTLTLARRDPRLRSLFGFIVDALILRVELDPSESLGEVGRLVRTTCLEAFSREVPITLVAEAVPDVGLMFADDQRMVAPFQLVGTVAQSRKMSLGADCTLEIVTDGGDANDRRVALPVDGLVSMVHWEDAYHGVIEYAPGAVDHARIVSMSRGIELALSLLVRRPDLTLGAAAAEIVAVVGKGR